LGEGETAGGSVSGVELRRDGKKLYDDDPRAPGSGNGVETCFAIAVVGVGTGTGTGACAID
jgi:hypothetical protein